MQDPSPPSSTHQSSRRVRWLVPMFLALVALVLAACTSGEAESEPAVASLSGVDLSTELVEVEPDGSEGFEWRHAYRLGELPTINVGHASDREARDIRCIGVADDVSCAEAADGIDLIGLRFGGNQELVLSWLFVPENTAEVKFTNVSGESAVQTPFDGVVIFPSIGCPCEFESIDSDGQVIESREA